MEYRCLSLAPCIAVWFAACAHPAPPPAASPPIAKAPTCTTQPSETVGPGAGATIICEGVSAVSYDDLREAALFDSAKAALAARRTHLLIASEERRPGAPATECPKPAQDENLRARFANMTGGEVHTSGEPGACKPIAGSEGHVLTLTVRFLRNAEAARVSGARSAAEVLGMSSGVVAPPAHPAEDAGSDGPPPSPEAGVTAGTGSPS